MFKLPMLFFVMLSALIAGVFSYLPHGGLTVAAADQGQVLVQLMDDTNPTLMLGPMIEGGDVMLASLAEPMLIMEGEESNP